MRLPPLLFPPLPGTRLSLGLLALRLVAGPAFILHGWGKIQSPFGWMGPEATIPGIFQAAAALAEFGGGVAWLLGFLTPLGCLGLLPTMAVATFFHVSRGDPFVGHPASYEPALLYFAVAFLLLAAGPGRFSVDALVFGEEGPPRPGA